MVTDLHALPSEAVDDEDWHCEDCEGCEDSEGCENCEACEALVGGFGEVYARLVRRSV